MLGSGENQDFELHWLAHERETEDLISDDTFYCFVDFAPDTPQVYVIPAATVAQIVSRAHQTWLDTPGRGNKMHNDSNMRRIGPDSQGIKTGWMEEYLERWDLIISPHG